MIDYLKNHRERKKRDEPCRKILKRSVGGDAAAVAGFEGGVDHGASFAIKKKSREKFVNR